jgi:20S proteasome subunit alpha 6
MQQKGAHLYETCPSGNFFDWKAQAIGARSQSAKTYLERHWKEFADCTKEQLIKHGLAALRETLSTRAEDKEPLQLTPENCAVGIVGADCKFHILSGEDLQRYVRHQTQFLVPKTTDSDLF